MDFIGYAAICAMTVASVTACGAGGSPDAGPTGPSVAPLATSETAPPCTSATADVLKAAALRDDGDRLPQPISIDDVRCSGDWAFSSITVRYIPDTNGPNMVLFHYDSGDWRTVGLGSGFTCASEGVPPATAAELDC